MGSTPLAERFERRLLAEQEDSNASLKDRLDTVKRRIELAVSDGVIEIDDDKWIEFNLTADEVEESLDPGNEILNYQSRFLHLFHIQSGIEAEEERRKEQLQQEWDEATNTVDDTSLPATEAWRDKFVDAREQGNIRVMEECVIQLRDYMLGEPLPDVDEYDSRRQQHPLRGFVTFVDNITNVEEHARANSGLIRLRNSIM